MTMSKQLPSDHGSDSAAQPDRDRGKMLRVLLVEDSPIIRARLAEALTEIPNVRVVGQAATEADALRLMREAEWDVAVLDLQLKQGTGLGLLKTIPRNLRPPDARIIVFTNYALPQYRDRSMLLGADYFFDKAHEFGRVRDLVNTLAGGAVPAPH
jgi:DNA-binding NarL/FixJ family response regulator